MLEIKVQNKRWGKIGLSQYPTIPSPSESLQTNLNLRRKDWCVLNRARCRVGRTKQNLNMWEIIQDPTCDWKESMMDHILEEEWTMDHILFRCPLGPQCKDSDLRNVAEKALAWLSDWRAKI